MKRVSEEGHLRDWKLEKLFKMADKCTQTNFRQVSLANAKTVEKNHSSRLIAAD